jgi:hypothetical protein
MRGLPLVRVWLVRRIAIVVAGLVLARFIPNRAARRFVILTIVPAIIAFLLERGRALRRPNAESI